MTAAPPLDDCRPTTAAVQVAEQFVFLFDMAGWRISHGLHLRKVHAHITTLQEHYPERLRAALLVGVPAIFFASWKLIRLMLDPVTASKVTFLRGGESQTAELLEHIDKSILPVRYGGERRDEDTPVPGELTLTANPNPNHNHIHNHNHNPNPDPVPAPAPNPNPDPDPNPSPDPNPNPNQAANQSADAARALAVSEHLLQQAQQEAEHAAATSASAGERARAAEAAAAA